MESNTNELTLERLADACKACRACALGISRTNTVFGAGEPDADLLFVGEAPGEQEDLTGTPFVGRAGQLLNRFLSDAGIDRDSVYIANILKCRPPKNRDPLPEEENACIGFLREQIRLIQPKMIVCLGRISAMRLIKPDFKITREHGQWFEREGVSITAVYHPALLLRDPRKKNEMLTDLIKIKARLDEMRRAESSSHE